MIVYLIIRCIMCVAVNDPDLHLQCFNDHGIYTLNDLNELSNVVKPALSFLHFNSRCLSQQLDELKHLLDSLPFTFNFLGCSETFITNSLGLIQFEISGYQLINNKLTDNFIFRVVVG